jgi:hypothetical protein
LVDTTIYKCSYFNSLTNIKINPGWIEICLVRHKDYLQAQGFIMEIQDRSTSILSIPGRLFRGWGVCSFVTAGMYLLACMCLAAIWEAGHQGQEPGALQSNAGRGTKDNLIRAGEWISFHDAKVRITEVIRPTKRAEQMKMFSDVPATGIEYILVAFEVECLTDSCNSIGSGVRLMDSTAKEWGEIDSVTLEDDLDGQVGIAGSTFWGWQAFEFPTDGVIAGVGVSWRSSPYLFSAVPAES